MDKMTIGAVALCVACACGLGECRGAETFELVRDGRPVAAFDVVSTPDAKATKRVTSDLALFNGHLKAVTGTELSAKDGVPGIVEIVIVPITNLMTRLDWRIDYPSRDRMRIEATTSSLFSALRQILERGCDARFLGVERCMFQFEPRRDVVLEATPLRSPANSFSLYHSQWWFPGHARELGFDDDDLFKYSHGLPYYAFPHWGYDKNGWPQEIMPIVDGKKVVKPRNFVNRWQPCFSNSETARIAIENIRTYLRAHPNEKSISLGVNDNGGYCECEKCRAMDANGEKSVLTNDLEYHSNSYYTWVNRVAEGLEAEFPDLKIGLLAYVGTIMPPPFPVHRSVVPMMTFDILAASMEDARFDAQEKVIERWSRKVPVVGTWEYSWGRAYYMPRVNFERQAHRLKFLHAHGGRAYFMENSFLADALDGPKVYLASRLCEDIDRDPEEVLDEWYGRFAGKAAAPVLKGLYEKCRDYWYTPEMRRSPQYKGRGWTYVGPVAQHLYALKPGFTADLLADAERVLALARTPGEKARASLLMRHFEMLDCHASFRGFGFVTPEGGQFATSADAVQSLDSLVRRAPSLMSEWNRSCAYFSKADFEKSDIYRKKGHVAFNLVTLLADQFSRAASHADDPSVRAALGHVADCEALPANVRALSRNISKEGQNAYANAGFVRPLAPEHLTTTIRHEVTDEVKWNGERTLKFWPKCADGDPNPGDIVLVNVPAIGFRQKLGPGIWRATFRLMTPAQGKEADVALWPVLGERERDWNYVSYVPLEPGRWQTFVKVLEIGDPKKADGLTLKLRLSENFKPDEVLYVGGVEYTQIGKSLAE